jgi:hypothetical protein
VIPPSGREHEALSHKHRRAGLLRRDLAGRLYRRGAKADPLPVSYLEKSDRQLNSCPSNLGIFVKLPGTGSHPGNHLGQSEGKIWRARSQVRVLPDPPRIPPRDFLASGERPRIGGAFYRRVASANERLDFRGRLGAFVSGPRNPVSWRGARCRQRPGSNPELLRGKSEHQMLPRPPGRHDSDLAHADQSPHGTDTGGLVLASCPHKGPPLLRTCPEDRGSRPKGTTPSTAPITTTVPNS